MCRGFVTRLIKTKERSRLATRAAAKGFVQVQATSCCGAAAGDGPAVSVTSSLSLEGLRAVDAEQEEGGASGASGASATLRCSQQ